MPKSKRKTAIVVILFCFITSLSFAEQVLKGGHILSTKQPDKKIWVEELSKTEVDMLEKHTQDGWILCPVCNCYYSRGEYFTNHKQVHIKKETK